MSQLSNSQTADELRWRKIRVGSDGFVCLVDHMGDDASITQAARVSYGNDVRDAADCETCQNTGFIVEGSDPPEQAHCPACEERKAAAAKGDRTLIRYLMRHRHCYAPWMQVLTARGWIRWDECGPTERFAVPDPESRSIYFEELEVEQFFADDGLHTFENDRMSYAVTPDHKMYFKGKYQEEFQKIPAQEMKKWGHFDPLRGYSLQDTGKEEVDEEAMFAGFYLGDGSYSSKNTITFHLTKDRKKEFLRSLVKSLDLVCRETASKTYPEDGVVFRIDTPNFLRTLLSVCLSARSSEKRIIESQWNLDDPAWCRGMVYGLSYSDGHAKEDRHQIEFSSTSPYLIRLLESCNASLGCDCHASASQNGILRSTAYSSNSTSLEARAQYFGFQEYSGNVYCTTTSTGLLMVRGGPDKFAFVCGNSTPFEMSEVKLLVRVPMDCWRQWIRHRTANVNEYSTRYQPAIDSMAETACDEWRLQASNNKQGSEGVLTEWPEGWKSYHQPEDHKWIVECELLGAVSKYVIGTEECDWEQPPTPGQFLSYWEEKNQSRVADDYNLRLRLGVAKEVARKNLPLSTYTEAYWKCDLHNILGFLSLRMDSHAQLEIREFANAIGEQIIAPLFPEVWSAFVDYRLEGMMLTSLDVKANAWLMRGYCGDLPAKREDVLESIRAHPEEFPVEGWDGAKCRERDEWLGKSKPLGLIID